MVGNAARVTFIEPNMTVRTWDSTCSGELLEEPGDEVAGVVHEHVDPTEALDCGPDGGLGLLGTRHVERDDEQVLVFTDRLCHRTGVAPGCHHRMAGGQSFTGDIAAHAASRGDEPNLLVTHVSASRWIAVRSLRKAPLSGTWESLSIQVLAGPPGPELAGLPSTRGHQEPDPRVPYLQESADHAGASGAFRLRSATGARTSQRGGGRPGRRQRRLLHANGARQPRRRLRGRPRGSGPWASARRRRAGSPLRPGPGSAAIDTETPPPHPAAHPPERAADDRCDDPAPALVQNGRGDILATNSLGRALFSELYVDPVRPANHGRFVFLSPRAQDFYRHWERAGNDTVAILRTEAGRDPYDHGLSDLVGELSTRSEEFRTRWAAHNGRIHRTGVKEVHHPTVDDLSLTYEMLDLVADPGLAVLTYTAEPGTKSSEALNLLGSWAATLDEAETAPASSHLD